MEDELFDKLRADSGEATGILLRLRSAYSKQAMQTMLDLEDMLMEGEQIYAAYKYCQGDMENFIAACATRNALMVNAVNACGFTRVARQHGPQKTIPIRDAVQEVLADAQKNNLLQRLDEGAEAFNRIFMTMLTQMQKTKTFTNILKINTGVDGRWAVFSITLQELQNPDGSTYTYEEKEDVKH